METKKQQKKEIPFDYNKKLMSLTKENILSINKGLNETIIIMQKEIDLYKNKYTDKRNLYIKTDIYLKRKLENVLVDYNKSLENELSLAKENLFLTKENTNLMRRGTAYFKEIVFLENRNLFQRIFNKKYKRNE